MRPSWVTRLTRPVETATANAPSATRPNGARTWRATARRVPPRGGRATGHHKSTRSPEPPRPHHPGNTGPPGGPERPEAAEPQRPGEQVQPVVEDARHARLGRAGVAGGGDGAEREHGRGRGGARDAVAQQRGDGEEHDDERAPDAGGV